MYFTEKIVWITGASSGIGEAMAYQFAAENARLIISSNNSEELEKVKTNCLKTCSQCDAIFIDLEKPESIKEAFDRVMTITPKIDVLVNNGGVSQRTLFVDTSMEIFRKIMEINLFGAVLLTKYVLPVMLKNGGGHIVATSSISGKFGFNLRSAYAASKHALHGFFESVRLENYKENIRVTIVCPGRVRTNISLNALTADGKAHGKMDDGQDGGITAESCAKQILRAIRKNKKEVLIGGKELLMVHFKRFTPFIFNRIIRKIKPT
ncbi:MAG: SDR family oxidoreductase [Bacteroidetes bacterium]|nr:SDR family oxidoreductase [Bacteroidota bacterium]